MPGHAVRRRRDPPIPGAVKLARLNDRPCARSGSVGGLAGIQDYRMTE
jgi:hypothetical protein